MQDDVGIKHCYWNEASFFRRLSSQKHNDFLNEGHDLLRKVIPYNAIPINFITTVRSYYVTTDNWL